MRQEKLLSIDLGTTSVKVALFTPDGELQGLATKEYSLHTPAPDKVELPAEVYWEAIVSGTREVIESTQTIPDRVAALSLSSQAETLVCVDKRGEVIRPVIVWLDSRAEDEARELAADFPKQKLYTNTGFPEMASCWPSAKLLWIRRNEPEIFARSAKFLILKDYILWRLTGEYVTDPSESCSTLYFDINRKQWWDEMLLRLGITRDRLPEIRPSHELAGTLLPETASQLGLKPATPVISGAMDQMAAALGAGNLGAGTISESTGTALAVIATLDQPQFSGKIPCAPHCVPDKYVLMPYSDTSGIVLKWFRETFSARPDGVESYDNLLEQAAQVEAGAEGLLALPHFTGTLFPNVNPKARGAFVGISFHHRRAHFIRALVEAVAFMLREHVDVLKNMGVSVDTVRSLGGAAKSDLWLQIKADVLSTPIEVPQCSEAASLGAAMLAGVGVGVYSDLEQAAAQTVRIERHFLPDSKNVSRYQEVYNDYMKLFQNLYCG